MDRRVTLVVSFAIEPGRLEAFREVSAAYRESVERAEPGTLVYDWWLSADGDRGLNIEVFQDSQALVRHMANVEPLGPRLSAVARVERLDVLGELTDEGRAAIEAAATGYHTRLGGIER